MQVLVVALALAAAAIAVRAILLDAGPARNDLGRAVAAAIAAIAIVTAAVSVWRSGTELWHSRASGQTEARSDRAGGIALGQRVDFLAWAHRKMQSTETFFLAPDGPATDAATYQWSTYQLFPSLSVARPEDADWLVFYDTDPSAVTYDRSRFSAPEIFVGRFALARRRAR